MSNNSGISSLSKGMVITEEFKCFLEDMLLKEKISKENKNQLKEYVESTSVDPSLVDTVQTEVSKFDDSKRPATSRTETSSRRNRSLGLSSERNPAFESSLKKIMRDSHPPADITSACEHLLQSYNSTDSKTVDSLSSVLTHIQRREKILSKQLNMQNIDFEVGQETDRGDTSEKYERLQEKYEKL